MIHTVQWTCRDLGKVLEEATHVLGLLGVPEPVIEATSAP
jgi:hypothetical protein